MTTNVIRWILNVDAAFGRNSGDLIGETAAWLAQARPDALRLLAPSEQAKVQRKRFSRDARLALGSCLLKRAAVCTTAKVPWDSITIDIDEHHKPVYRSLAPGQVSVSFNVSHHESTVVLAGCPENVPIGVDIVHVDENDIRAVMRDGFESFAAPFLAIFSSDEKSKIRSYEPTRALSISSQVEDSIRRVYAVWALKEAYTKMLGTALLEPKLQQITVWPAIVPSPTFSGSWGDRATADVWIDGEKNGQVMLEVQAYGAGYLVATCVGVGDAVLSPFQSIDLEQDIYPLAAK